MRSGPLTVTPFAGLASFSSPRVVRYGSGRFLYSATGSADWSPSSPDMNWSRVASMVSSAPQLSGIAHQLAGMGPCLSFGSRGVAHGSHDSPASCPDRCGGGVVARAIRQRVRSLLQPYIAADPRALLMTLGLGRWEAYSD